MIQVRVQPRSSLKGVAGIVGDAVKVKLTASPVDGAANEQLLEVLSEALSIAKSAMRISRGLKSRTKVIEIRGVRRLGDIHI